ncbi:hypothetical protein EMIHUDRAFT_441315 [Emiliania huxleyi CCMP1516]|uniref:Uncharacterized protein n=2 Tax=Emiliania huxleyi TaxID=2903 RepID=A0A0D3KEB9_EMIH1|nr:hypothetical protein EMIHUDRAFT_441315 [Emiliania huxleyi CCMP1516]EOD34104.1 hypothetical protein EMIHUDRAFT_441315 [Emiliania huxleyi CCMP1516]|eukprot:XP_005786533.1 hypothetical protein EMIHUDRAFT_441315 [Emiliania huxleyi CCMP1516]
MGGAAGEERDWLRKGPGPARRHRGDAVPQQGEDAGQGASRRRARRVRRLLLAQGRVWAVEDGAERRRRHAQLQLVGGAATAGAEPPARAFLLRQARAADGGGEGVGRRAAGRLHAHRPPPPRVRRLRRPRGAAPRVRPRKRARGEHHVSEKPVREAASDCSRGVCQSCRMLAGSRLGKRAGRWKGAGVLG